MRGRGGLRGHDLRSLNAAAADTIDENDDGGGGSGGGSGGDSTAKAAAAAVDAERRLITQTIRMQVSDITLARSLAPDNHSFYRPLLPFSHSCTHSFLTLPYLALLYLALSYQLGLSDAEHHRIVYALASPLAAQLAAAKVAAARARDAAAAKADTKAAASSSVAAGKKKKSRKRDKQHGEKEKGKGKGAKEKGKGEQEKEKEIEVDTSAAGEVSGVIDGGIDHSFAWLQSPMYRLAVLSHGTRRRHDFPCDDVVASGRYLAALVTFIYILVCLC
jgi:hypothetical protein